MVGRDKPVLSEVEGLIPAYNVFLLIEKWNYAMSRDPKKPTKRSPTEHGSIPTQLDSPFHLEHRRRRGLFNRFGNDIYDRLFHAIRGKWSKS